MAEDSDDDRVRRKAHQLWEAEGRPHGRDADHWTQAREIIAIEDSQSATLLPRDAGSETPIENADEALRNLADFPNLTDQGENLLTSTDREPDGVPTIEVPTSDQPGMPAKPKTAARKKSSSAPAQPVSAPPDVAGQARTPVVPKRAAAEKAKDTGAAPATKSPATPVSSPAAAAKKGPKGSSKAK